MTVRRLIAGGVLAMAAAPAFSQGLFDDNEARKRIANLRSDYEAGQKAMEERLARIDAAIADGRLAANPMLAAFIGAMRASRGTCHLIGLASPGGVHSHQDHAVALAKIVTEAGVPVVVHAFTDGRDTPPQSSADDLRRLTAALPPSVTVATVIGRYYVMDRDKRWERVAKAYSAIVEAEGPGFPDPHARRPPPPPALPRWPAASA